MLNMGKVKIFCYDMFYNLNYNDLWRHQWSFKFQLLGLLLLLSFLCRELYGLLDDLICSHIQYVWLCLNHKRDNSQYERHQRCMKFDEMILNCSKITRKKEFKYFHRFTLSRLIFSVINLCIKLRSLHRNTKKLMRSHKIIFQRVFISDRDKLLF